MAWRAARSLLQLHRQLQAGAPGARPPATPWSAWGLIGDAAHDPTSDHAPHDFPGWGNEIVTAGDFPNAPALGLDARRVLDDIRRSRDPRAKYGISNGEIFSNHTVTQDGITYDPWKWRPYKGSDGHYTHGHLSVVGDARADGEQPWATIGGGDMTPEQDNRLKNVDRWLKGITQREDPIQLAEGPWANKADQAVRALESDVTELKTAVEGIQAGQVSQEAVTAAVLSALRDPEVQAILITAAEAGSNKAEDS
jgi:hypothetical protein